MPGTSKLLPLRQNEAAAYRDVIRRPNPQGFAIAFIPALGALLLAAEREKRSELTRTEVKRMLDRAPAIALTTAQVKKLVASRGYADVEPADLYTSWRTFRQAALNPQATRAARQQKKTRAPSKQPATATPPAVLRFADILSRRIDSPEVLAFLKTWKTKAKVYPRLGGGEITAYRHGFDAILSLDEAFGKPRGKGKSTVWIAYVRLFAPEYCQGKKIRPYEGELVAGLRFPLTRTSVRKRLGKPVRTRKIPAWDEYLLSGCQVHFVRRRSGNEIVFVELAWPNHFHPYPG